MRGTDKLATAIALALVAAAFPATVLAQVDTTLPAPADDTAALDAQKPPLTIDYTLGLGVQHTDNVNLSHDDPISQNLLTPNLTFAVDKQGSRVQAHATGQIEYVDYLEGQYVNEFRGQFTGGVNWVLAPQRLSFAITDSSGVQPVQTRVEYAPDNLQQVNVFSAGPTMNFRLGEAMRGQAELIYTNTLASKTKYFDSSRGAFALRAIRDLDPTSQLSFNAEAQHVEPRQTDIDVNPFAAPSYTNYRVYANYQSNLPKVQLNLSAGWTDYRFNQGVPGRSGAFGSLAANWQVTPRSTLGVGAAHQFNDVVGDIAVDQAAANTIPDVSRTLDSGLAVGSSIVTSQVFEENQASLSYAYVGDRFGLRVSPYVRRRHYINNPSLDLKYRGASSDVTYLINPLLTLGFSAEYDRIQYLTGGGYDTYTSFGPSLTQQLTQHWSWQASFTHYSRHGSTPERDFVENSIYLAVRYRR